MYRIFVEKKKDFNFEARNILKEVNNYLGIKNITNIRVFNGYDIENISDEVFEKSKWTIFAENGLDNIYIDIIDLNDSCYVQTTKYLLGQYDQRADFSEQLLKLIDTNIKPIVRTFKCVAFYGAITQDEIQKIKSYYINSVESYEINLIKPETIKVAYKKAKDVDIIKGFANFTDKELTELQNKYSISMSIENLNYCKDYYAKEQKEPTITELKIFDTYWSDHCRHSTFLTKLENINIEKSKQNEPLEETIQLFNQVNKEVYKDENRPLCFMDIATMQMKKMKKDGNLTDLEESDEINACSIVVNDKVDGVDEDFLIMFKNETHNHPTEIEPFGGASTCIGGGIRDPLSGRSFVYGAMRVTGSADPRESFDNTLKGKLSQRKITKTAADGYSSYANQIGLASGHLQEYYDDGFKAKRMECGALVAYAHKDYVTRGKAAKGDVILIVGGNTGRDGLGGATGSSKEQDEKAFEKCSSEVQKGNPLIERNIVRLFRNKEASKIIKKCNDFGAGGVSVAIGELADSLIIDLNKVPLKYEGLDGTEIAISESQERMAVLIDGKDLDKFIKLADDENLNAIKVAEVTDNKRIVMHFNNKEIVNIDSEFLNSGGVRQSANVKAVSPSLDFDNNTKCSWLDNLKDLNVCSKKGIASYFDTTSSNATVLLPYGGKYQKTPELGLAMKVPVLTGKSNLGTLMTVGYNPKLGYKSPFHQAMYAVIESVMKVVALGGDYKKIRLSFQEYYERLTNDESFGKPFAALMGAFLAQNKLNIPSVGGKDSMSGTFKDINVPPSLISFAVATIDVNNIISREFKKAGSKIILVDTPVDENGMPDFDILKSNLENINKLMLNNKVLSCSTIGYGGIAAAISEMAFGNKIGFEKDNNFKDDLFKTNYFGMILEVKESYLDIDYKILGTTTDKKVFNIDGIKIDMQEALNVWENVLEDVFTTKHIEKKCLITKFNTKHNLQNQNKTPNILIPIFLGTTSEYELVKQFGKYAKTMLFKNKTPEHTINSFKQLEEEINNCDVLVIPHGMSAGAEPDGSAKIISLILSQNNIKNSINKLIDRNGLIIGIGEGFKALVKLGLIQNGYIKDNLDDSILISKNSLNKYECAIVGVEIINNVYPFTHNYNKETVPVSTIEGSVYMTDENYNKYLEKGQIVSVYAGYNPFETCIEAMISENGQVFGRMGLIERLEEGLYKNVADIKKSPIFDNIIEYFLGKE